MAERRGPIPCSLSEFPWAVENRVVRGPILAVFRDEEDAVAFVEEYIDLRVIPTPFHEMTDEEVNVAASPVTVTEEMVERAARVLHPAGLGPWDEAKGAWRERTLMLARAALEAALGAEKGDDRD